MKLVDRARERLARIRPGVVLAAVGLAAAACLGLYAATPPGDPFRATLLALPWVVAALELVARDLGSPRRRAENALGLVLLVSLVALILGRHSVGLGVLDRPLYAALLLLLAWRLAILLPVLRRRLGRRLPARPPAVFFLLPLIVYLALLPWSSQQRPPDGDEPYYLLITHSLAYDFDVDLANNYAQEDQRAFLDRPLEPQPGDPAGPGGEIYSRHNLVLPLVLAPAYRLGGLAGALMMMSAMAALLPWLVLRLAYYETPEAPAAGLFVWALCAFAPPLLGYSQQIWIEVPAALLLAIVYDRVQSLRRRGRVSTALGLAAGLVLLPLLKLRLTLPALGILALAARVRRRVAWIAVAAVAAVLGLLLVLNQLRFANPLKMHSWRELGLIDEPPAAFLLGGLGMFYDAAFGLFLSSPLWLLLLPAAALALVRRHRLPLDLALVGGPYLLLLAPRLEWYGGWSPPFRYPLVLLPLLALLLLPLLAERRAGTRLSIAVLAPLSLLLAVLFATLPGWTYNLADGGTHLLDAAGARFGLDAGRLFPSMVRPRLATWLWPLASLMLVPIALARRPRRSPRPLWGVVLALAALALVPVAADTSRTRTLELEDGFIARQGGSLHPPPWTVERPRYRGGWSIGEGTRVAAPVVGEGPVTVRLVLRYVKGDPPRPFTLRIAAGDVPVADWVARGTGWQTVEVGPLDWPAGAPLVLRGPPAGPHPRRPSSVIVDYADFYWQ